MISAPIYLPKRTTPIHIFTVRLADGTVRRKVIPGGYCKPMENLIQAKLNPGDKIIDRTWRPDWRALDWPAGTDDYGDHNPVRT